MSAHAQERQDGRFAPTVAVMQHFSDDSEDTPGPVSQDLTFATRQEAALAAIAIGEKWVHENVGRHHAPAPRWARRRPGAPGSAAR